MTTPKLPTPTIGSLFPIPQLGGLLDFYVDKKIAKITKQSEKKSGASSATAATPTVSAEPTAPGSASKFLPYAIGAAALIVLVVVIRK